MFPSGGGAEMTNIRCAGSTGSVMLGSEHKIAGRVKTEGGVCLRLVTPGGLGLCDKKLGCLSFRPQRAGAGGMSMATAS